MTESRQHLLASLTEFHRVCDVPSIHALDKAHRLALTSLRATLIEEELLEVTAAIDAFLARPRADKRTHVAKELTDLVYVAVGTAEVFRLPLADPRIDLDQVRAFPFSKLIPVLKERAHDVIEELISLMRLLLADDADAGELTDLIDGMAPLLQSLVDHIAAIAYHYRIPLVRVFTAVHASNMSKANPATGKVEYREDGKVLKGKWYREPDLDWLTETFALHPGAQMQVGSTQNMAA